MTAPSHTARALVPVPVRNRAQHAARRARSPHPCRARRLAVLLLSGALSATAAAQDLVVIGQTLHTMDGRTLTPGAVAITDGRITGVGTIEELGLPDGQRTIVAEVVVPGFVDAHTTVGLAGMLNQDQDQDAFDRSAPLQPELRALDSYNGRDPLVPWLRSFGVTTVNTGHAPGAVISGDTLVVKLRDDVPVDQAVLRASAMVCATLGDGARDTRPGQAPGTRSKAVALLRQALADARAYVDAQDAGDDAPDRDLRREALGRVIRGEAPLLVTAHRHHDILAALRIADEFAIPLVLDGAAEAYSVTAEIAARGVPVIVHPAMTRSGSAASETAAVRFDNAALLKEAGIPIAQQSGFEGYVPRVRVLPLEAAIAARYGLSWEDTLASITIDAARLLGVDDRVGSITVGKDADLALYDGDPFEYGSHCTFTIIDGEVVWQGRR